MNTPAYLIRGQVMHERMRPAHHRFVYPVFCLRINLSRLEEASAGNAWFGVNRRRLMSLRTRDYGPRDGSSLDLWMRKVLRDAGLPDDGEIWLQTFPRLFGYAFNPVSFWYCHDSSGALRSVLAEVNNTFGETHRYLLAAENFQAINAETRLICAKSMHVSPFCEVRGAYRFRFRDSDNSVMVAIDYDDNADSASINPDADNGMDPLIYTAISGKREVLNAASTRRALLAQPLMTFGIIAKIHWQAWKLWRKRVPFFRQPYYPPQTSESAVGTANFNKEISS